MGLRQWVGKALRLCFSTFAAPPLIEPLGRYRDMTTRDVTDWTDAVLELSLHDQAVCVRFAAESVIHVGVSGVKSNALSIQRPSSSPVVTGGWLGPRPTTSLTVQPSNSGASYPRTSGARVIYRDSTQVKLSSTL